ncbi:MAG: hypothetical protein ACRCV7_03260 [Culicoidibacterales bacterium]
MDYFKQRPFGSTDCVGRELLVETKKEMTIDADIFNNVLGGELPQFMAYETGEYFSGQVVDMIKDEIEEMYRRYNQDLAFEKREVLYKRRELLRSE